MRGKLAANQRLESDLRDPLAKARGLCLLSLNVSRLAVIAMRSSRAVEEEIYTHEYLWRSASMLVEKADN